MGELYRGELLRADVVREEISGSRLLGSDVILEFADGAKYATAYAAGRNFYDDWIRLDHYLQDGSPEVINYIYGRIYKFDLRETARFWVRIQDPDKLFVDWPFQVYQCSDWDTVAKGAPIAVNGSTIINPTDSEGACYPFCLGRAKKVKAIPVLFDYDNNRFYYIFHRGYRTEATNAGKGTKINVYRNKRLVTTTDPAASGSDGYMVYNGSQSFFPNCGVIVFYREQKDANRNQMEIHVDCYGETFGEATAVRNPIDIGKYLIQNSSFGLGEKIVDTSWLASAQVLESLGPGGNLPILIDGAITEQVILQDFFDRLLGEIGRSFFWRNPDERWDIKTDYYRSTPVGYFGSGDTYWRNITKFGNYGSNAGKTYVKQRVAQYAWDVWRGDYQRQLKRTVDGEGEDVKDGYKIVRDPTSIDLINCYEVAKLLYSEPSIDFDTGMAGRGITLLDPISVVKQWIDKTGERQGHSARQFIVRQYNKGFYSFGFSCTANNSAIYDYDADPNLDASPGDDEQPDYSFTPPGAPTSFQVDSSGYRQAEDGTTVAYYRLSAVAPTVNCAYLEFGFRQIGEAQTNYLWSRGTYDSATGRWKCTIEGYVPGLSYAHGCRGVNPANEADFQQGVISELTSGGGGYTAPGDTVAPSKATNVIAAAGTGRSVNVSCDASTSDDVKEYWYYRYTSNNPSAALSSGPINKGGTSFTDESVSYGQSYRYWVVAKDFSKNPNPVTAADFSTVSNAVTVSQVNDDDISGVEWTKVNNVSVSLAQINTASIGTLSALCAYLGSVTVQSSEGVTIQAGGDITFEANASDRSRIIWQLYGGATAQIFAEYAAQCGLRIDADVLTLGSSVGGFAAGSPMVAVGDQITAMISLAAANFGSGSKPWGDLYVCDGWRFYKEGTYNAVCMSYGGTQYFAFEPGGTGGDSDRGTLWTGDLTYEGSLNHTGWTKDFTGKDKLELLGSVVDAYKNHDGQLLHPELQKVVVDRFEKQAHYGKSPDDLLQLVIEILYEHLSKEQKA